MESAGNDRLLISIILPVRNEAQFIGQVLHDLARQSLPSEKYEVIVVDGLSDDNTVDVARTSGQEFTHFQILSNPSKLASSARNIGLKVSRGDYIIFIDGHCQILSTTLLADMLDLFERHTPQVLCRPQPLTAQPMTYFQQAVASARASAFGHGTASAIYSDREEIVRAASAGAMYRRDVFDKIGLFDENFDACEDLEFNTRADLAGLKAMISPKLTVHYAARKTISGLFKQLFRYGVGRWRLLVKYPKTFSLGDLIPVGFVLGLVALPLFLMLIPAIGLVLALLYSIYLLLSLTFSLNIALRQKVSFFFILPIIYFIIHTALGIGFLASIFKTDKHH